MNVLTAELADVAADLQAAGIPATIDPGMIRQLTAGQDAAALVAPPDEVRPGLGMAAVDIDVTIWLLTRGPDDLPALDRLFAAALPAMRAALPLEAAERDTYTTGGADLPALRWTTARRIPYPTVRS